MLEHLALAGPLTIGEAAAHLRRAQSVVSEVAHLERQGLLEREADPADRRRTLIWLTAAGHTALRHVECPATLARGWRRGAVASALLRLQ